MPGAQRRGHATAPMPPRPISRESTQPASVLEGAEADSIMSASRPPSLALMPPSSACSDPASPPSLRDILTNNAPPPYTLGAFTAFLSQNHCMETLEFTMDADRYSAAYSNLVRREQASGSRESNEYVSSLWKKIISAYIVPYGHREVNLPAHVRDRLLSLSYTPVPPDPSELDEAVRIVYELMNDSVLGPFLASVTPQHDWTEENDPRHARSRLRIPRDMSSSSDEASRSPKVGFLPMFSMPWATEPKSSTTSSSEPAERGLTDSNLITPSPASTEPMTPPTTPPVSDWEHTSPGVVHHRAASSQSSGWKRVGAKLGFGRISRSKRGHSSSATSGPPGLEEMSRREPDHPRRKTNPL
ncbi:RGS domain-containing protein [Thermothelomyces heterothallicus CBS 202.75]|uniref:RGS domain-containing protein n=1 Tax=Thermothelomyces heterothallicus CBS 202.75 TaxID=1149848 RepID=UPI00374268A3